MSAICYLCLPTLGLGDVLLLPKSSVCLCLSVTKSCPLCNLKTVHGIFMKLHININQHWTKSCPLCNFKTVHGIFMKLHTNINQQSARTITLVLILFSYVPLNFLSSNFLTQACPLYNFKTVQDIFIKLHTNIKHHKRWPAKSMKHNSWICIFLVTLL